METRELTAHELDQNEGNAANTHNANKPFNPKEVKLVINETVIRQVNRTPLDIQKWRNAHINADSRYYPNRTWLYDLYDDCLLDLHLDGIIDKRFDTVLNKPLLFKKEGKIVDALTELIHSTAFRTVCRTILETKAWGISGIEYTPGKTFAPAIIPRKHIKPKWQIIAYEESGNEGIDYTDAANIMIIGEPDDLGFLLKAVPYIIYKRNATADWAQYIEIFGQPIRVMYYDAYDQQAKIELKKTLDESGSSLALMIPKGVEFKIEDGKVTNGDGKLQSSFINFINQELSVLVLGNTETTTNGQTGSQAKSKVHKEQQDEISKSDMFYLTCALNSSQFLNILKSYGYPVEGGRFEHTQEISIDFLAKKIEIDDKVAERAPIDDDYWYTTYGIAKPKNYEAAKAAFDARKNGGAENLLPDRPDDPKTPKKGKTPKKPTAKPQRYTPSKLKNLFYAFKDFFDQAR